MAGSRRKPGNNRNLAQSAGTEVWRDPVLTELQQRAAAAGAFREEGWDEAGTVFEV